MSSNSLPQFSEHALRQRLNDEVHARPPVPIEAPMLVSYLAFTQNEQDRQDDIKHLARLCRQYDLYAPELDDITQSHHLLLEVQNGALQIKWERHNEFSSYTFYLRPQQPSGTGESAILALDKDWLEAIPGQLLAAAHVDILDSKDHPPEELLHTFCTPGETVIVSHIANKHAWVFTDFKIYDGFSRFIIVNDGLSSLRAGRTVQRILEIEVYRLMALLAFPVAKEVGGLLADSEHELAQLISRMNALSSAQKPTDQAESGNEDILLCDLTRLAALIEHEIAHKGFRFGASQAYFRLVLQRISELKESTITGQPTICGFMQRRLVPALETCESVFRRLIKLSERIASTSELLRTHVSIELEHQNQLLLAQMNHRARLQLRLQQTVEGLSVVVLTYYGAQLVHYLLKGSSMLHKLPLDVSTALSIPIIALLVFGITRRVHHKLKKEDQKIPKETRPPVK